MPASPVVSAFEKIVTDEGLHAGLRFLNTRTPHRFTGVYRYDGDVLRNECLFDQFAPETQKGDDVRMVDAYCATVGERGTSIEFSDIGSERTVIHRPDSPVVAYCGALIRDAEGRPFGTLCHYDVKPCQTFPSEMLVLESIAPLVFRALEVERAPLAPAAA